MYTYQQRLEYAKRLQRLQQAVVIKDNIHLTYKYKNRNKAYAHIDSVQDRINNAIIEDAVNGNAESIKGLEKQGEKLIHDTLTNERKRLHQDKKHKAVNHATKSNSQYFTNIFNYRRKKIGENLEDKIERALEKQYYYGLSDSKKIEELNKEFGNYGKKRLKNIVTDAMHTNESNIGFIKAIEDGFNYKVWKNGRVAKGRTRAWHKQNIIQSVPIDETFDIYGSYPAHMMYPGDLNGGAENVANCRCWLYYTNNTPDNLRGNTLFKVSPNFKELWAQKSKWSEFKSKNSARLKKLFGIGNGDLKYNPKTQSYNIPKNYVQFYGKTLTGVLPNGEKISKYFSKDVSKTHFHDKTINLWVNTSFDKRMRIYANQKFRENKIRKFLRNHHYSEQIIPGYIMDSRHGKLIMKKLMRGSYTKVDMVLHRQQDKLYLGNNPKVGQVIEWDSYNATSISKEGLNHYSDFVGSYKWKFTILAPKGTRGVYVAPKAGKKYSPEMEFILDRHTKVKILDINYSTHTVLLKIIV